MTPPVSATANAAPARTVLSTSVPFKITNRPDGELPDMEGFSLQRLGSMEKGWYSLCPIRADRDLAKGEVLSACLVRECDGEMVRLDYTAVDTALKADQWPQAFAQHIVDNGAGLSAGGWASDGKLTCGSAEGLRLWCRNPYRAFSTAPFKGNLVQALACDEHYALDEGKSLCLQVRDLATQHLYEHHVFTPTKKQAGTAWAKALCEQINDKSHLLRAGALGADGCTVAPAATGNAFWVAQCAQLSVTLAEVTWWAAQEVDGDASLPAEGAVQAWAYDAYSHRLLAQFSWSPTQEERKAGQWLSAWATALNASALSPWLYAAEKAPSSPAAVITNAKRLTLWQRGEAVRVFTTLPASENWVAGPALASVWDGVDTAVLVTVRHPYSRKLLGHEVFVPANLADQNAWEQALAEAIGAKRWPEVAIGRETADAALTRTGTDKGGLRLWQPRFAELLVELESLGESSDWEAERLSKYLGDSPEMPVRKRHISFPVEISKKPYHAGSALVYLTGNANEMVFRLSPEARQQGYRVAGCYRETGAKYISESLSSDVDVISVTSDTIVWSKGRVKTAFNLVMDFPDSNRGHAALTIGHIGYLDDSSLWQDVVEVSFSPPAPLTAYEPSSPLCEDYGNTIASEVFDTAGQRETGVDPRTGLFHAHYPVATLQGLAGRGPVCELTLHYSALRGNEAGLGDGWAWRFASLDTRDRRLVLENGAAVVFTDDEWKRLGQGTRLSKHGCFIRSNQDWSQFTLDLSGGRQEILGKPRAEGSDEEEPNDEFRLEIIRLLEAIKKKAKPQFPAKPSSFTQWALAILCPLGYTGAAALDYNEALKAWGKNAKVLDERIAYYKRPFAQLVPHTITSPYGETLTLSWQRLKGQFLLKQVHSGDTLLLESTYSGTDVGLDIWPTHVDESFHLSLSLKDYLLRTVRRTQGVGGNGRLLQEVSCDYCEDPTLDRVLYRLQEGDGSVERVEYLANAVAFADNRPALPRVSRHRLIPGSGTENTISEFAYQGSFVVSGSGYEVVKHVQGGKELKVFDADGNIELAAELMTGMLKLEIQREADPQQGTLSTAIVDIDDLDALLKALILEPWMIDYSTLMSWRSDFAHTPSLDYKVRQSLEKHSSELSQSNDFLRMQSILLEAECGTVLPKIIEALSVKRSKPPFPASFLHLVFQIGEYAISKARQSTAGIRLGAFVNLITGAHHLLFLLVKIGHLRLEEIHHLKLVKIGFLKLEGIGYPDRTAPTAVGALSLQTQQISYTSDHDVKKIVASDNKTSYRCYYPAKGDNTAIPEPAKALGHFPTLSCPDIPAEAPAPLMAEYQCDVYGNPLGLILYSYRAVKHNERHVLETDCIVTLEGLKATLENDELGASTTWALVDPGHKILWRMRRTASSEPAPKTANIDCKVKVWSITDEQTTVLGDQPLSITTVQRFEDNPAVEGLQISTHATTAAGTELVSREVRSRFSRRCLSKTVDGHQTDFSYDGLGRVTKQVRYRLKADGKCDKLSKAETAVHYSFDDGSLIARVTQPDGSERRDHFDGLQQAVYSEWRRTTQGAFLPLGKLLQGNGDEVIASQAWDYLPGGQAVCEPLLEVKPLGREAWSRDLMDSAYTVEKGLGPRTLLSTSNDLQSHADGTMTRRETQRSTHGTTLTETLSTLDANGRVTTVEQTLDGAVRKHRFTRDELGRVTRHERPDGSVVQRSYYGLSEQVTELRVFENGQATTGGQLLASQELSHASRLTKRRVGTRQYGFEDDNVTLPDKTLLAMPLTRDSGQYKAGAALISGISRSANVTTLTSDSGQASEAGLWKESLTASTLPGRQRIEHTTPYSTRQGAAWQTLRGHTVASLQANGHWQRDFYDHYGRLLRSWHDHQDILHRYDDLDRLVERRVLATQAGAQWQVGNTYDVFGRETLRTFSHNGQSVFVQQLEWQGDGKLAGKRSAAKGKTVCHEHFTYDALDRLATYTCTADTPEHCPSVDGKPVAAQRYSWDALSNMTVCATTYRDGKTREQAFSYGGKNPTQLTGVTSDGKTAQLAYNTNGYQILDASQRTLKYNAGGQLTEVMDEAGTVLTRYAYDGYQRLANQYVAKDTSNRELRYAGDALIGEDWFDAAGQPIRQRRITPGLAEYEGRAVNWLVDDPHSGIAGHYDSQGLQLTPRLPFGEGATTSTLSSGYNGMRQDPVTGTYHAGNGYRCYDPALYRHAQPDWLSPFGEGGLNEYVYCPDPINLHDPSGAIMLSRWGQSTLLAQLQRTLRDTQPLAVGGRWRGIAFSAVLAIGGLIASVLTGGTASMLVFATLTTLSAASLALEVAAVFIEDSDPELARRLGIASMVTGVLSIGNFVGAFKQAANLLRSAVSFAARLVRGVAKTGWRALKAWGSRGFIGASRYLKATSKAAAASRIDAQASAAIARTRVTDALGELTTSKFALVESDPVQKLFNGNDYTLITGWQARINARVTQLPGWMNKTAQAGDTAIVGWVLKGGAEMAMG